MGGVEDGDVLGARMASVSPSRITSDRVILLKRWWLAANASGIAERLTTRPALPWLPKPMTSAPARRHTACRTASSSRESLSTKLVHFGLQLAGRRRLQLIASITGGERPGAGSAI